VTFRSLNLALAVALGISSIAQAEQAPTPRTLVEVNGEAVKDTHFLVYRAQRGSQGQQMDQQAQLGLLNELVNTVMIAQDAVKQGLDKHPELQAAVDVARYRILAEAAVEQYLRDHPVEEKDIEALYKANYADAKLTEYKARHILLKTEDEAKAVIAELDKGADFAELAKTKSTGPSGPNGGDLGWFEGGQMVKPFADAVATMKKGGHSAQPVQTQFGWHVIKLEDSRPQTPPKLDEVRGQLSEDLQRDHVADFIRDIRAKADVKVMEQQKAKPEPIAVPTK
jgi:peptidyl-prolyl cis-trans isomerase C